MSVTLKDLHTDPQPDAPSASVSGSPRRLWALLITSLALFVISIDNLILNVALPSIARELQASSSQMQWLVDGYVLSFAGLLLVGGAIGDRIGRKRALLLGLVLFGAASAMGAVVTSPEALIVVRAAMGAAAALVMPATLSIVTVAFPPAERPKAIAVWSAVGALSVAAGPVLGGALLEEFWWGSLFLINVPIVVTAVVAGLLLLDESRGETGRIDVLGALLSVGAMTLLVFGIIEAPAAGWTDPLVLLSLAAGAGLLGAFITYQRRISEPLLDVRLFTDARFTAASLAVTLMFFALMGVMFFLTQYLQFIAGYSPLRAGAALVPAAITLGAMAPVAVKLLPRLGTRTVVASGLAIIAVGMALLAQVGVESGYVSVLVPLVIIGAGMGLSGTPATESIMAALPTGRAGVGSAVNDTTREVGGALGVAVLGSLLSVGYTDDLKPALAGLPPEARTLAGDGIAGALAVAEPLPAHLGQDLVAAAQAAFVSGMNTTALVGAAITVLGALVAGRFLPGRAATPRSPSFPVPPPSGASPDDTPAPEGPRW